ncbi:MAG TPA: ABC transporter permease subunit [Gemmataceae bacterium]|nr:ABC transporter permease subunit [Gemmataceae bacterium]
MKPALVKAPDVVRKRAVRGGFDLTALAALAVLTLREHLRGRRLLILSLLFLLPSVLAVVARLTKHPPPPEHLEFVLLFNLLPHALAPLTALLYAAGIIQDEVEEQTLTYLLLRPLPRWALYITKLAVTIVVTSVLTGVFAILAYGVIYWNTPELGQDVLPGRALKMAALLALAQVSYCALFGTLSLITRRALLIGLGYIVAIEGLLASFESVLRRLTVMYYFRVLSLRWLEPPDSKVWSIDLTTAPSAGECVQRLLGASVVLTLLGAVLMMRREFRMKTPEGS